jgi:PST family polysaccharide transporter
VSLKAKSVKGVVWSGGGRALQQLLGLGVITVFARQLAPGDFGLMTMVMVFQGFVGLFRTMGLGTAVIQRKEMAEDQLTSVFLLNLVTGAAFTAVVFFGAPFVAWFYGEPQLVRIAQLTSFSLLFTCVTVVHEALLVKRLEFHRVVKAEFYAFLIASGVAIVAAFKGLGVYALVLNSLCSVFFSSLFVFIANPWLPKARPNWRATGDLFRFGMNVMGMNLLNYVHRHTDDLLVGKFLGKALLGQYSMAYRIMRLPTQRVSGTISQVAFPAFSSVQDDPPRIRRGFLKMTRYIALMMFPALIGLIITAPDAIPLGFGRKWLPAVFIIQVLTVAGLLQALQSPMSTLFLSRGRPNLLFRYQILSTACYVGAFLIGVQWGIRGVAVCYAIVTILLTPLLNRIAFKLIELKASDYFDSLREALFASLAMAGAVMLFQFYGLKSGLSPLALLIVSVAIGVLTYPAALWLLNRDLFREGMDLLKLLTHREGDKGKAAAENTVE